MEKKKRSVKTGRFLKGFQGFKTHGDSVGGKRTILYTCWRNMMSRCYQVSSSRYYRYGGRGIQVCIRWHQYENFKRDLQPSWFTGSSLERRDLKQSRISHA